MLVLTRKIGEAIQIGDDVSVEILELKGGRVRLGIKAPSHVGVRRQELILNVTPEVVVAPNRRSTTNSGTHSIPIGS